MDEITTIYSEKFDDYDGMYRGLVIAKRFIDGDDPRFNHYVIASYVEHKNSDDMPVDDQILIRWHEANDAQVIRKAIAMFDDLAKRFVILYGDNG